MYKVPLLKMDSSYYMDPKLLEQCWYLESP